MVRDTVRTLWAEPRAPNPPRRVWRDWVLVAALVPTALLEGVLRDDVVWRPVSVLLGVALPWTLLWRRTHPLAVVEVAFGAIILADIASLVGDADGVVGLYTMIFILLFPYSLVRWGSGREIGIGSGDHRGHRDPGHRHRLHRCRRLGGGVPLPALPGNAGRDGALLDVVPAT